MVQIKHIKETYPVHNIIKNKPSMRVTQYINIASVCLTSIGFTLFGLSSNVLAAPELKGSPDELRQFLHPHKKTTTLFAEGEKKTYTDEAIVSLTFTTENKLLEQSLSTNSKLRQQVIQQLIQSGVSTKDINSAKFSSSPEYGWFGKKPDSYKVVNRMTVTITDEQHLQILAKIADNHKDIQLTNTEFNNTKEDEDKRKAKSNALEKIMKQKDIYEEALNITLTPININESNIYPIHARQEMTSRVKMAAPQASIMSNGANVATNEPSSFDEVIYKATMSIEFIVEPKK